jgi:hypothetical protein
MAFLNRALLLRFMFREEARDTILQFRDTSTAVQPRASILMPRLNGSSLRLETWRRIARQMQWWWRVDGRARMSAALARALSESWLLGLLVSLTVLIALPLFSPLYVGGVFTAPASLVTLLSTVAQTLAALVGISIAVVLVALEILRGTYATIALREVFRTPVLRRLLTLYLYTIALALFVASGVGTVVLPTSVALSYLVGLLSVTCLIALYPSLKSILRSSRADYRRLVELAAAVERGEPWKFRQRVSTEQLEALEVDPLYVLSEVAIQSVSHGDRVIPRMVIGVATNRLLELLKQQAEHGDADETRDLFGMFLPLFKAVGKAAIKQGDELTLLWLFGAIETIQKNAASLKVQWSCLVELNEYLEDIGVRCIEQELQSSARSALRTIEHSLEAHLRHNVPEEKDVWLLNWMPAQERGGPIDHDKGLQWEEVERRYIDVFVHLVELSLKRASSEVATSGLIGLSNIMSTVARLGGCPGSC